MFTASAARVQCPPAQTALRCTPTPQLPLILKCSRRDALLRFLSFPAAVLASPLLFTPAQAGAAAVADLAADVFTAAAPSVLCVGTLTGPPGAETFTPVASGVVWDSLGHIVTPYRPVNPILRQSGPNVSEMRVFYTLKHAVRAPIEQRGPNARAAKAHHTTLQSGLHVTLGRESSHCA